MIRTRFEEITARFATLRVAVIGDLCLDRYFEIDPARSEISLETGLAVRNVVRVRCQAGAAGTIVNNLSALGVGTIIPVAFVGVDGEGFELRRNLAASARVDSDYLVETPERRTFTYTKPLLIEAGQAPVELNRFDIKNWTPTPGDVESQIIRAARAAAERCDAIVLMDQVDHAGTGVVTKRLLDAIHEIHEERPDLCIIADSRRSLRDFPPVIWKMNGAELAKLTGWSSPRALSDEKEAAAALAQKQGQLIFVTLAERGMIGAAPSGQIEHVAALPFRGEIDIVGAGDAVTANLIASLAGGANLREAMELATTAASIVLHQLGTTGTASVAQISSFFAV